MVRPAPITRNDRPRTRLTGIGGVSLLLLVTLVVSGPARATLGQGARDPGTAPTQRAVLGRAAVATVGVVRRATARTTIRPAALAAERLAMLRRIPTGSVAGPQAERGVGMGLVRPALLDLPPPLGAAC